jgi:hypothetical protein
MASQSYFPNPRALYEPVWVTKQKEHLRISDMETSHIINSVNLIVRINERTDGKAWRRGFLPLMIEELRGRGIPLPRAKKKKAADVKPYPTSQRTADVPVHMTIGGQTMKSMQEFHSPLSFLRATSEDKSDRQGFAPIALRAFHEDKGYAPNFGVIDPHTAGEAFRKFLIRSININEETAQLIVSQSRSAYNGDRPFADYRGTPQQNVIADRMLTMLNRNSRFMGEGAAARYDTPTPFINSPLRNVAIAIIGMGAAGIMAHEALEGLGFRNITVFEKLNPIGIWGKPNVYGGTKNNPRELKFGANYTLKVAEGNGTRDGSQVKRFLDDILDGSSYHHGSNRRNIKTVVPSHANFNHTVITDKGDDFTFPIVINCMGTGKPRTLHDPERMKIMGASDFTSAVRWQSLIDPKDMERNRYAFIGLGNSTAEMMSQVYEAMDKHGIDTDFRILTHFPKEAVFNPSDTVEHHHKWYRVFRDLSKPDLTAFQGDLERSRNNYYRALAEGRIITDVREWGTRGKFIGYNTRSGSGEDIQIDKLFALVGYQHEIKDLAAMGIPTDADGHPRYDHDGEFRDHDGIQKGHFGFGAVCDAPHNKNSVVIPGMMFRLPDLLYGVIQRAAQYAIRNRLYSQEG